MAQWKVRGAEGNKILTGNYYAYELQGLYEFSDKPNDKVSEKKLRIKSFSWLVMHLHRLIPSTLTYP
ncbi:MAG: hypothetical protein ABIX01_02025 [Chitinophagaceae bacterium]